MQVNPASSLIANATSGSSTSTVPAAAATATTKTLGINDFMKLLATQFQEQDPLQPMDDTAFIAQTAQFTALQQTSTLTQSMTQMAAANYIGSQVQVSTPITGATVTGTVTGVDTSGTTPNLIVNGAEYPLTNLLQITAPAAASTSTTASSVSASPAPAAANPKASLVSALASFLN